MTLKTVNQFLKIQRKDKGRGKIILFYLFFLPILFGFFLHASAAEKTYVLKSSDYRIIDIEDGFQKIDMSDYFSYAVPGYPDLPTKIIRIALPPSVDIESISVSYSILQTTDLGKFNIKELSPLATWEGGQQIISERAEIYSNNKNYPEEVVEYLGFSQMRKWRMANIKYTPFQYNPVTRDLIYIPEVWVHLDYHLTGRSLLEEEMFDELMDIRASKILLNHSEAKFWYPLPQKIAPSALYNYVIITTHSIKNSSTQLNNFLSYLSSKGFFPLVVTESDFGGLTGPSPNGTAEKIRKWLQNNYLPYGIEYVLLIGNPHPSTGDIPMKMCWPRHNESSYQESPTDYYYADLTGNWDLDGDTYFCEYQGDRGTGGVDFANEVYVGRIPVYSGVSQLDSVLSKIISYGNSTSTDWRKNVLLPMSFSDSSTDGAYLSEAMISNYLSPAGFNTWRMYMQGSLCSAANSSFWSDQELVGGATKTRWMNNTYGMVWWWGHGNSIGAYLGYDGCGWGTILESGDTSSLDNDHPAFVYQCSCENGYPEVSNNIGTALLYQGAITTVTASRVSWYAVTSWNTGLKYYCDNASIGYYYGRELAQNEKSAGEALYHIKSDMGMNGGTWGGTSWMNLFDFNLYGDPSTIITPTCSTPETPTLVSPSNGAAGISTTPTLDWGDVFGATSYDVQVCSDSGCSSVVRSGNPTSSQWAVTPALNNGTQYWWRARANNACGSGSYNGTWSFTTGSSTEVITTPTTPTGTTSGSLNTSYSYTTGGSTSSLGHSVEYQFDWKGDSSDLSPWGSSTQSKTWTTAGTYFVRAKARCTTDTSAEFFWSPTLTVRILPPPPEKDNKPFGSLDAPSANSTISGPVVAGGWALDDVGVTKVELRSDISFWPWLGDLYNTCGTRPDIAALYPDYPNKDCSGWGIVWLTNFMSDYRDTNGNRVLEGSTHQIYLRIYDTAGQYVDVGHRNVTIRNDGVEKPFGAINTPSNGEILSGPVSVTGWALAKGGRRVTKVEVVLGATALGEATYGVNWPILAQYFPTSSYPYSENAAFEYLLDTTLFLNGQYALGVLATDEGGNIEGIGSRYIYIQN